MKSKQCKCKKCGTTAKSKFSGRARTICNECKYAEQLKIYENTNYKVMTKEEKDTFNENCRIEMRNNIKLLKELRYGQV